MKAKAEKISSRIELDFIMKTLRICKLIDP